MKKSLAVMTLFIFALAGGILSYKGYQDDQNQDNQRDDFVTSKDCKIEWKNENVELQVRMKLEKFNTDIYLSDILDIHRLSLEGKNIYSLEDLSAFKNLKSLTLKDTDVQDFSPLTEIPELAEVNIIEGIQPTVDALSALPKLKILTIWDSEITDITSVTDMKELSHFEIRHCKVEDITALKNKNKLSVLYLNDTEVKFIPKLEKSIEDLDLSNNQISDIGGIKDLKNLRRLCINNNQIANLEPLRKLKKLTVLEMENNCVRNIGPISNLPELKVWKKEIKSAAAPAIFICRCGSNPTIPSLIAL